MPDTTHLQDIRQEMPATQKQIYLNTGTFGPLPTCVTRAVQERIEKEWQDGRLGPHAFHDMADIYEEARQRTARLLHADPLEIALTDNTGEGINIIISGFNWHEGDEVITTNHEHMSALIPLFQIRDRFGVVIRIADLGSRADNSITEAIQAQITPRTRLIALSHVTWTTGTHLDIHAVTQLGQEHSIPVLVDGAQAAGAIPLDLTALDVDFYALPMQKWLCGPDGTGALYIKQRSLDYVSPTFVGYWSVKNEEHGTWTLHDSTRRFESGGRQTAALAGQKAVLAWLEEFVGYPWLFGRIKHLHTYAHTALQQVPGLTLLTPRPGESGLLTVMLEGHDEIEILKRLQEQYHVQLRTIPGKNALRLSTGFYNTEEEIDIMVRALTELIKEI